MKTIPACFRCGTIGHRAELCPSPNDKRCCHCGQEVGATADGGMDPHEWKPTCLIISESHLTGSQACIGKFRRIQHVPPKSTKTVPRVGGENKRRRLNRGTAPTGGRAPARQKKTQQQLKKARDQSAPALSSRDFPALGNGGGATSSPHATPQAKINKVGSWAGVASPSLCPPFSPELNELRQELAALRAENAKLITKICALEEANRSAPLHLPSLLSPADIPAVEAEPMGEVLLQEEHLNLDSMSAPVIDHEGGLVGLATLPRQIEALNKKIENRTNTVTRVVTSNIKTWLQEAHPRLGRRVDSRKGIRSPSLIRPFDLSDHSEDAEPLPLQGLRAVVAPNVTPFQIQHGGNG